MFVVTIGDAIAASVAFVPLSEERSDDEVIAGAALILLAVGGTAVWVWVALVDRKRRKKGN